MFYENQGCHFDALIWLCVKKAKNGNDDGAQVDKCSYLQHQQQPHTKLDTAGFCGYV